MTIKGQMMLSFEMSVFDLALSLAVIVLIGLFVATLLKLNPSTEKNQSSKRTEEVFEETLEPSPAQLLESNLQQAPEQSRPSATEPDHERNSLQRSLQAPRIVVNATLDDASEESSEQVSSPPSEDTESRKQPEPRVVLVKTPKNSKIKECPHQFGYLKGFPKNRPIPKECLGCQRMAKCLVNKKGK